jgi:hypothetical protein
MKISDLQNGDLYKIAQQRAKISGQHQECAADPASTMLPHS